LGVTSWGRLRKGFLSGAGKREPGENIGKCAGSDQTGGLGKKKKKRKAGISLSQRGKIAPRKKTRPPKRQHTQQLGNRALDLYVKKRRKNRQTRQGEERPIKREARYTQRTKRINVQLGMQNEQRSARTPYAAFHTRPKHLTFPESTNCHSRGGTRKSKLLGRRNTGGGCTS